MALIGLLEDEPDLCEELHDCLCATGHRVVAAGAAAAFFAAAAGLRCDVVVLDRGLPDADGLDIVERLRGASPAMGIVLLTEPARGGAAFGAAHGPRSAQRLSARRAEAAGGRFGPAGTCAGAELRRLTRRRRERRQPPGLPIAGKIGTKPDGIDRSETRDAFAAGCDGRP
jgi:CheY-like chemotaxis protein